MTNIDQEFKINVGNRLRELRENKGMTVIEVAKTLAEDYYCNIDEKSIRRYEKGDFLPKIDNLICLAELYDSTLDYIVYGRATSDDNSFTWYDTFKRLNRLIYPLTLGFGRGSEDGKIYLELWDDEAKVYYDRIQSFGVDKNYMYVHKGIDPNYKVKEMDALFEDFKNYKEQLTPNKERQFKYLKSQGEDPEKYIRSRIEEIKSKREK